MGREQQKDIKEDEIEAWEELRRLVLELEEKDGDWLDRGVDVNKLKISKPKLIQGKEEAKEKEADALGSGGPEVARRNCQGVAMEEEDAALEIGGQDIARSVCQGAVQGLEGPEAEKGNCQGGARIIEMEDRAKIIDGVKEEDGVALEIRGSDSTSSICQGALQEMEEESISMKEEKEGMGREMVEDRIRNQVGVMREEIVALGIGRLVVSARGLQRRNLSQEQERKGISARRHRRRETGSGT